MATSLRSLIGILGLSAALGCGQELPPVNRVGVNAIEKSVFEGSWYMSRTVVDVDFEASGLGTFPGDIASDAAMDFTSLPRVRFVIDEDTLYAYRDYDLVRGGDGDADHDADFASPVAAFAIEKHFDVRRAYDPSTGEERNVLEENDTDAPWYDRAYMRVDWSKNLLPGYFGQTHDLYELLGNYTREPAALYVQDRSKFPEAYAPRFDRMGCTSPADERCEDHERDLAADYEPEQLYHMTFVTQEVLSPATVDDPETGEPINWCAAKLYSDAPVCSAIRTLLRTSFLRVSDKRQYEPVNYVDSRFERFGYFRLSQPTVDRSTKTPGDPAFGQTDFLNYNVNRHNLWMKWHGDQGEPLPYAAREVRKIVWYTTPELPAHLVQPAFDVVGQWNESFMATVRALRGEPLPVYPEVDCQTDDPDGYCYCQTDPETGETRNPTCPGRYDPFRAPGAAGGARDPYRCHVEVPEEALRIDQDDPALSDEDFEPWFRARFVGDECVTILRVNTCNRESIREHGGSRDGLQCQERGDLRLKFLSYVDQPGTSFLGIATLRGDPVTGEIIAGDANIGGPALDGYRTAALQTYDLVHGELSELELQVGEDVRGYFENLGRVEQPARPRSAVTELTRTEIDRRMAAASARLSRLSGPDGRAAILSDRKRSLIGSALERRLVAGLDEQAATSGEPLTEAELQARSPLRHDVIDRLAAARQRETKLSRRNVHLPSEYVDDSVQWFVQKHADWPRARLEIALNRLLYRQTELHELGHCFGLRHDFGASADTEHYGSDYYDIAARHPLPDPARYERDGAPGLSVQESLAFEQAYDAARSARERSGIDAAMSSSVMEYTASWYERLSPLGRYDHAAIAFGYGELVEAYDGPASFDTPRPLLRYYQGGEACETDADCPLAAGGVRTGELLPSNERYGLTQRCVGNPGTQGATLCSNLDDDLAAHAAGRGPLSPLRYRFCSDERADASLAWCNRFDEGDSYREIVRNVAASYDRMYLFAAFRRYRKSFSTSDYSSNLLGRRLSILQNLSQDLVYRYQQEPAFRSQRGDFGFYDQFLATTDVLNFYARVLAQPNVGGYGYDPQTDSYVRTAADPSTPGVELPLPLGLGRYFYSDYQAGLTGIERLERIGSIYDKLTVMELLTTRGASADYTRDVVFFSNFYDLFPNEMQQIWNGMVREFPRAYMPRVHCTTGSPGAGCQDPRIVYMDFYRGDCSELASCRPDPAEVTYAADPVLDGGGSIYLQIYAALYGLSEFPVYFDTSFQNQLFVCIEGQADCPTPAPAAVEGTDYVRYQSPRYRRSFLAFQVEPAQGVAEQTSIGFAMVKEARGLDALLSLLRVVRDGPAPYSPSNLPPAALDVLDAIGYELPATAAGIDDEITRVDQRIVDLESFFNQMVEIQRSYGIRDFSYYVPSP